MTELRPLGHDKEGLVKGNTATLGVALNQELPS
jgi:hypothetical protein